MFGWIKNKLLQQSEQINQYYCNAVRVWVFEGDQAAAFAALAAATTAVKEHRDSMVDYLHGMAKDISAQGNPAAHAVVVSLQGLARQIQAKDWSIADAMSCRRQLHLMDKEYGVALDRTDPTVFQRRYPGAF